MAAGHVWGIDIGQCGLKALRGRMSSDGKSVVAETFDYIEYPQILSQPDADPDALVREALKTFLSRNSIRGDKVAISLSGQSGLARFIKLPPVDAKTLPNLVGFEAKQQIPFALEDVVWDYQKMPGETGKIAGRDEDDDDDDDDLDDDLPMETEVGLFAIKRDQVLRSIRPLVDAEVELDLIQLSPVAIYNAFCFDQLKSDEGYDPDKANDWIAVLSMGTDTSDLVVTNGFRVWQRSIPIGGNHFTKQLTKELKLTFAKAELEKRNARAAENAKDMFKAMRPTFGDLVTETQRSLGFFGSLEKKATVKKLFMVGNAAKLPGLPQFIEKQLEIDVVKLKEFERLDASGLSDDDSFKENLLTFPVCYGLVTQGLSAGQLGTNLVPREIVRARVIRRKKPWAAAIAASLLLACAFNFFFHYSAWNQVNPDTKVKNVSWSSAKSRVGTLNSTVSSHDSTDTENLAQLQRLDEIGEAIVGNDDGRKLWLELLKTVTDCLPVDPKHGKDLQSLKDRPFQERPEIFIDKIESQYFPDVNEGWYTDAVKERHKEFLTYLVNEQNKQKRSAAPADPDAEVDPDAEEPEEAEVPESPEIDGGAWVIELQGHHFVRDDEKHKYTDKKYVRLTLMNQLENGRVKLPVGPNGPIEEFGVKEMGIFVPILVMGEVDRNFKKVNQDYVPPTNTTSGAAGGEGGAGGIFGGATQPTADEPEDPDNPKFFYASRYKFTVQFCWKQIPLKVRLKQRIIAEKAAEEGDDL